MICLDAYFVNTSFRLRQQVPVNMLCVQYYNKTPARDINTLSIWLSWHWLLKLSFGQNVHSFRTFINRDKVRFFIIINKFLKLIIPGFCPSSFNSITPILSLPVFYALINNIPGCCQTITYSKPTYLWWLYDCHHANSWTQKQMWAIYELFEPHGTFGVRSHWLIVRAHWSMSEKAFLYGYNHCLLAWPLVPYHLQNLNEATVHSSYWHWCMMGHGWHLAVSRTASLEKESGHVWKGGTNFSNPPRLILALPWHSPGPLLRLVPPWMGWSWWMTVGLCSAGQAKT